MLTQLQVATGQLNLFTFTIDQLTQALTQAWLDKFVGNIVYDSSTVYNMGTWQYPVPSTMTTVRDIYIIKPETNLLGAGGNYPEKISQDLYEVVNGQIQFTQITQNFINDTVTLYIKGYYALTVNDPLLTDGLINYVLANAAYILTKDLIYSRIFVFLRNDTTLADIINARKDLFQDMLFYRQALLREFESL